MGTWTKLDFGTVTGATLISQNSFCIVNDLVRLVYVCIQLNAVQGGATVELPVNLGGIVRTFYGYDAYNKTVVNCHLSGNSIEVQEAHAVARLSVLIPT